MSQLITSWKSWRQFSDYLVHYPSLSISVLFMVYYHLWLFATQIELFLIDDSKMHRHQNGLKQFDVPLESLCPFGL